MITVLENMGKKIPNEVWAQVMSIPAEGSTARALRWQNECSGTAVKCDMK